MALSRVESLQGLYLAGVNERMFLVSPDAVMLDDSLRAASREASARLADKGASVFKPSNAEAADESKSEFAQDALF